MATTKSATKEGIDSCSAGKDEDGAKLTPKHEDASLVAVASQKNGTAAGAPCKNGEESLIKGVSFKKGDEVEVFFRFEHVPVKDTEDPFFAVSSPVAALQYPRVGLTDGWLPAIVEKDFPPELKDGQSNGTAGPKVKVQVCHKLWGNRQGELMHAGEVELKMLRQAFPRDVRLRGSAVLPKISFVCMRWGCYSPYHDSDGAWGGWGPFGCCICDKYIKSFFNTVYDRIGPAYEVYSVFVQSSADLRRLNAGSLVGQLAAPRAPGGLVAGMYFLWPVAWLDGHAGLLNADDLAGYIEEDALLKTMSNFEAAGVPTRHPHPSHLYRLLTSKNWSAHMCLSPGFHVPATTRINRATALNDPLGAARCAIETLRALVDEQNPASQDSNASKGSPALPIGPFRGVAKLGFAWEAREVYHFQGEKELANRLRSLIHQAGSTAEAVFVQRYVPHDCEIRVYCIHGKPEMRQYTRFGQVKDDGAPTGFRALQRQEAVDQWFGGDDAGLSSAEQLILNTLVPRWVRWLCTESCEVPSAIRMDFFVKVLAGGTAEVHLGELTEQGASTLGWEGGALAIFNAVVDTCLQVSPAALQRAKHVEPSAEPSKRRKQNENGDTGVAAVASD